MPAQHAALLGHEGRFSRVPAGGSFALRVDPELAFGGVATTGAAGAGAAGVAGATVFTFGVRPKGLTVGLACSVGLSVGLALATGAAGVGGVAGGGGVGLGLGVATGAGVTEAAGVMGAAACGRVGEAGLSVGRLLTTALGAVFFTVGFLTATFLAIGFLAVGCLRDGLFGVTVAREEGLEMNILALSFGIDLLRPAIKLPGIGRIGMNKVPRPNQ